MTDSRTILLISHSFPPVSTPASYRVLEFARHLPELGWCVHVLCPRAVTTQRRDPALVSQVPPFVHVHHFPAWDLSRWQMGYRGRAAADVTPRPAHDSHSLRRVILAPREFLKLAMRRVLFPDVFVTWMPAIVASGLLLHRQHGFDLVFATGDPWSVVMAGAQLAKLIQRPFVADFRELWSGHSHRRDQESVARHRQVEQRILAQTALVVANSPMESQILASTYIAHHRPQFIDVENGFNPNAVEEIDFKEWQDSADCFVIAYTGSFGYRRPDAFLKGLADWLQQYPERRSSIRVKFAGPPEPRVTALMQSLGLQDVTEFLGYLDQNAVVRLLYTAHLLLVFVGTPINQAVDPTVPAKMYEYAATGRPMLVMAKPGGATRYFAEIGGFGMAVDNEDDVAISAALQQLYMRFRAGDLAPRCQINVGRYTRQALAHRLAVALDEVVKES